MTTRNIVIVTARCSQTKGCCGIRFERRTRDQWMATWSFAIKEPVAQREGYETAHMVGRFGLEDSFPGCPHCAARTFFRCDCGKLGCWNGESRSVTCPWCGQKRELRGEVTSLTGGTDR